MSEAAGLAMVALAVVLAGGSARSQTTELITVDPFGGANDDTGMDASISADGRFVAFGSPGANLVHGDMNCTWDVFVRDRVNALTELVSVDSAGTQANFWSTGASISADGRFVAFVSSATNLVANDTNQQDDVFLRDRLIGTTERVSVGPGGVQANHRSPYVAISATGRFLAIMSLASNLVPGDANNVRDIFLLDRQSGIVELVSVSTSGIQGNNGSEFPSVSADGRFVTFSSLATNLVPGDTNGVPDVFLWDRSSGTTARLSVGLAGAEANGVSAPSLISSNGRFVAFGSHATNLVPGDTNPDWDCFFVDLAQGTTERVSVDVPAGASGPRHLASISANGNFVAFLVPTMWGSQDVYLRDRPNGTTELMSPGYDAWSGNGLSFGGSLSADGRYVAFHSYASNLVPADADMESDVFVRDRGAPPSTPFCFGDGTGTACPCGNLGLAGNGCANSVNANGANLTATGTASLASDTLVLLGNGMPNSSCLYFQGESPISVAFGDGLRCVANSITRLGTKANVEGRSQYPAVSDAAISARGNVTAPGTRTYQIWYRNAAAFCTAATFNLTNGTAIAWAP